MARHIHIIGISGTFMACIAILARQLGFRVTGCDQHCYPPISTFLAEQGIEVHQGYDAAQLDPMPDDIVVGNVAKRGMPIIEHLLNQRIPLVSGPEWLVRHVLAGRHVLAVSGTHGKTTTSAMLTWILAEAGLSPGYLIAGMPENFTLPTALGTSEYFVIEADEYDTAFFDKRAKCVHYRPTTCAITSLEYDHADIYDDLSQIMRQFHHMVRLVPSTGLVVHQDSVPAIEGVIAQGCWTPCESFELTQGDWQVRDAATDGSSFEVVYQGETCGRVQWSCLGDHNMRNALVAMACAHHVGVDPAQAVAALGRFLGVKRRMQLRGEVGDVQVYDDFAHHPTAIKTTLAGMASRVSERETTGRVIAILEPRSHAMKLGAHGADVLGDSLAQADHAFLYQNPQVSWDMGLAFAEQEKINVFRDVTALVQAVMATVQPGDRLVVMSNGAFDGIHERLLAALPAALNATVL